LADQADDFKVRHPWQVHRSISRIHPYAPPQPNPTQPHQGPTTSSHGIPQSAEQE
jgi:hypothetical protein